MKLSATPSSSSVRLYYSNSSTKVQVRLMWLLLNVLTAVLLQLLRVHLPVVHAVWYSEICHTGPPYKVRIDPVSGKLVPVTRTSSAAGTVPSSSSGSASPQQQEYQNEPDTIATEIETEEGSNGNYYDTHNIMPATIISTTTNIHAGDDDDDDDNDDDATRQRRRQRERNNRDLLLPLSASSSTSSSSAASNAASVDSIILPSRYWKPTRTNRIWRDFDADDNFITEDEDDENEKASGAKGAMDAIIIRAGNDSNNNNNNKNNDIQHPGIYDYPTTTTASTKDDTGRYNEAEPSVAKEFEKRFLQEQRQHQYHHRRHLTASGNNDVEDDEDYDTIDNDDYYDNDELRDGEFYVKPCLCPSTRWTFPDSYITSTGNSADDDNNNNTTTAGSTTLGTAADADVDADNMNIYNEYYNNNYGQYYSDSQFYFIPENREQENMYLCQVTAVYCGIPLHNDGYGYGDGSGSGSGSPITVKCYNQNMRHIIARNAWPLILLWYFGLSIICCCTVHGRTAGDYLHDRITYYIKTYCCYYCCANNTNDDSNDQQQHSYNFNDRMLTRMMYDDEQEHGNNNNNNNNRSLSSSVSVDDMEDNTNEDENAPPSSVSIPGVVPNSPPARPWFYSNQRRNFERSLLSQVQWIWRHHEYLREIQRREDGLPPPQLKIKVKRFRSDTTTSGKHGIGFNNSNISSNSNIDIDGNAGNGHTATTVTVDDSAAATIATDTTTVNTYDDHLHINISTRSLSLSLNDEHDDNNVDEQEYVTLDLGTTLEEGDGGNSKNDDVDVSINNIDNDSLEEPMCAICMSPFEEGDRIGDLACKHEFHVHCLKGWAQRKNSCPLCNVRLGCPERPSIEQRIDEDDINNNSNSHDDDGSNRHSSSASAGRVERFMRRIHGGHDIERTTTTTAVATSERTTN